MIIPTKTYVLHNRISDTPHHCPFPRVHSAAVKRSGGISNYLYLQAIIIQLSIKHIRKAWQKNAPSAEHTNTRTGYEMREMKWNKFKVNDKNEEQKNTAAPSASWNETEPPEHLGERGSFLRARTQARIKLSEFLFLFFSIPCSPRGEGNKGSTCAGHVRVLVAVCENQIHLTQIRPS